MALPQSQQQLPMPPFPYAQAINPPFPLQPQQQFLPNPMMQTKLYIGDLDENMTEETLFQVFSTFGKITEIKLPKNNEKQCKGFAYITFHNPAMAKEAKEKMNHEKILINPIRICQFRNKNEMPPISANIFVSGITKDITAKDLEQKFKYFGDIFTCKIAFDDKGENLGYGFVQYEKVESAEKCLAEVEKNPSLIMINNHQLHVTRYKGKEERQQLRNNLYIKNLPQKSEEEVHNLIKTEFSKFGKILSTAVKMDEKKKKFFAFVCYEKAEDAKLAFEKMNNSLVFDASEPIFIN